jgi:hypothetical protein
MTHNWLHIHGLLAGQHQSITLPTHTPHPLWVSSLLESLNEANLSIHCSSNSSSSNVCNSSSSAIENDTLLYLQRKFDNITNVHKLPRQPQSSKEAQQPQSFNFHLYLSLFSSPSTSSPSANSNTSILAAWSDEAARIYVFELVEGISRASVVAGLLQQLTPRSSKLMESWIYRLWWKQSFHPELLGIVTGLLIRGAWCVFQKGGWSNRHNESYPLTLYTSIAHCI